MTKLIKHNQKKKAIEIFEKAKHIRVYTLDNNFSGTSADVLDYKDENWLLREWLTFDFSRLSEVTFGYFNYKKDKGPRKFLLDIHDNCWYEFEN